MTLTERPAHPIWCLCEDCQAWRAQRRADVARVARKLVSPSSNMPCENPRCDARGEHERCFHDGRWLDTGEVM